MSVADLEATRSKWVSENTINDMNMFPKMQLLLGLYLRFWSIGANAVAIVNSGVPEHIYWQIQNKVFNFDYKKFVQENVADNWANIGNILMDIPGKECESIGIRMGLAFRRLGGIDLDGIDVNWDN